MIKLFTLICLAAALLAGCSSLKPLNLNSNQLPETASKDPSPAKQVKFLNDISLKPSKTSVNNNPDIIAVSVKEETIKKIEEEPNYFAYSSAEVEAAGSLQIKYAILLNTEVEEITNLKIFEYIDQWYGTRYCMGGTTKNCIDCSAFVQFFFSAVYGVTLPRTAREQYNRSRRISRTELREGDLLFYNTRGGISHVGVYLQNNKFVHSATSDGVTISDVFDPYWLKRFVGVGRVEK